MKPLDANQMLALLPVQAAALDSALLRFEDIVSTQFWKKGDCKRMIDEGFITVVTLSVKEVPSYLIGYHFTDDGGMWIDLAQKIGDSAGTLQLDCAFLALGVDLIARQERRRYIRFYTIRRALASYAKDYGYQTEAVLLTKEVMPA